MWSRPGLTPAQRSLVTISVLAARGHLRPLREHIQIGLGNGLTSTEIIEAIIQCSLYAGFPAMVAAMEIAADVLDADAPGAGIDSRATSDERSCARLSASSQEQGCCRGGSRCRTSRAAG